MKKEFIPYEQALALKELGFNRRTLAQYNTHQGNEWILTFDLSGKGQYPKGSSACIAPTFSQAFRFFREKYDLHSYIDRVYEKGFYVYEYFIDKDNQCFNLKRYEEAELECLKKLIEIVKTKETC